MSDRLPTLSAREAVRTFERAGFRVLPRRGKGSHIALVRDDWPAILILPNHGDVPRQILRKQIQQAGMTVEQFNELR